MAARYPLGSSALRGTRTARRRHRLNRAIARRLLDATSTCIPDGPSTDRCSRAVRLEASDSRTRTLTSSLRGPQVDPATPGGPGWPVPLPVGALGHGHVEHRVPRGDAVELLPGCGAADRDVRPGSRRALQAAPQDRGTLPRADLVEPDDLTVPAPQHRTPMGRADVADPVRALPQHRHQVSLTPIIRDHDGKRDRLARTPPGNLQHHQLSRARTSGGQPSPGAIKKPGEPVRAPSPVQPAVEGMRSLHSRTSPSKPMLPPCPARCRVRRAEGPPYIPGLAAQPSEPARPPRANVPPRTAPCHVSDRLPHRLTADSTRKRKPTLRDIMT